MGGLCGKFNLDKTKKIDKNVINKMADKISHRGTKKNQIWCEGSIGICHMGRSGLNLIVNNEDYSLAFDGRIYNIKELNKELQDESWQNISDEEILLKLFTIWGVDQTLNKIDGTYAIVLYEKRGGKLFLIRDKLGIKPLHYYMVDEQCFFSSEIKSILPYVGSDLSYDTESVLVALSCNLWTDPQRTIFKDVYTVEPGYYLEIDKEVKKKYYYQFKPETINYDIKELIDRMDKELNQIIEMDLENDDIAACLSGGLDSSLVCKIAGNKMSEPLDTFTVYYEQSQNEDLEYANMIAQNENFNARKTLVKKDDYSVEMLDRVLYAVEDFLLDKVYVALYKNYEIIKKNGFQTVLAGEGSDELWIGYLFKWGIFNVYNNEISYNELIEKYYLPQMIFGKKIKKKYVEKTKEVLLNYLEKNITKNEEYPDYLNEISTLAIRTILHNLLMQEDKIGMAHSLENCVPFVEKKGLFELAMSTPGKLKIADGREKYPIRELGKKYLPSSIVERNKLPFPEPSMEYDEVIKGLCIKYWEEIKSTKILVDLLETQYWETIENFNRKEQWFLLMMWRFETVFMNPNIIAK